MTGKRIVISVNTSWNLVNFRSSLIKALIDAGHDVIAAAPEDEYSARLADLGCRFVPMKIDNAGTNPFKDLGLVAAYWHLFRRERPDVYLGFTIKPNIYGSWAAHLHGIRVVNNVAGLGTAFISSGWLTVLAKFLYRSAFSRSYRVFFQNADDRALFIETRLVEAGKTHLLPGSGIDLDHYSPGPRPHDTAPFTFLLVARLLWDKGIGEYVEAARIVKERHPDTRFQLLGFLDSQNRTAIPADIVDAWQREGLIDYLGQTDDVRPVINAADCVVLPSYREGMPRSLLEAAAMAKPLIASDVPGCRSIVDAHVNGLLCEVRNGRDLADKMSRMRAMPENALLQMGQAGRKKAEREFDENKVINSYLSTIAEI